MEDNLAIALSKRLGKILSDKKLSISTAESCTGGLVSHIITMAAGSSNYFWGGIVSYKNEIKSDCLGVKKETLDKYGAVSPQAALEMAKGALVKFQTNIACSVTGIAGPGGATENKPVGLVYICVANGEKELCEKYNLSGARNDIQQKASIEAINLITRFLKETND